MMNKPKDATLTAPEDRNLIRVRTLINLRWFAVLGQLTVTMVVHFWLQLYLPLFEVLAVIAVAVIVNVVVLTTQKPAAAVSRQGLMANLIFDSLQISTILYLTGGIDNPFVVWLILPAMLGAFALDDRHGLIVVLVVVTAITVLALWHLPLPWLTPEGYTRPAVYNLGAWAAMMLGVGFTASYARQVALTQMRLTTALEATQAVLAREERLTAVGGLAAIAAHELGTPLGTIQVTAREMERDLPDGPLKEDAQLLISQTQRCHKILVRLSQAGEEGDARHSVLTLDEMLRLAAKPFLEEQRDAGPHIEFTFDTASTSAPPDQLRRLPAVIYGLRTLIENAVKYGNDHVEMIAHWDDETLKITIEDDGPGFTADVLARLGEPFSRDGRTRSASSKEGLGLGFFIAKTLLERSGAQVLVGNRLRRGGAWVEVVWPLAKLRSEATSSSTITGVSPLIDGHVAS